MLVILCSAIAPDYGALHHNVCSASVYPGRLDEAKASFRHFNNWYDGEQTTQHRMRRAGYLDTPTTRRFFEGPRLAGMRERLAIDGVRGCGKEGFIV